ncbi:MAG TPA: hypothetical protein VH478_16990 [Trebonia sp.]|jgi:hypothetical protein|nr:hypothetical protein [Trebonia sp.]
MPRAVLVLAGAVLAGVAGCGGGEPAVVTQSASVTVSPADVSVVRLPGGVSASVPAGAAARPGRLTATLVPRPAPIPAGLLQAGAVYAFAVTGTPLTRPATITLPAPGDPGGAPAALLGAYAGGRWTMTAASYDPRARSVSALVSPGQLPGTAWAAIQLDDGQARNQVQDEILSALGAAGQPPPACPGSPAASRGAPGATASSGASSEGAGGGAVEWCSGQAGGHLVLRVTNNRGYAVEADYPAAWSQAPARPLDPVTALITGTESVAAATSAGTRAVLIPGGGTVELLPGGAGGHVSVGASGSGYQATAFAIAVAAFRAAYGDVPGAPAISLADSAQAVSRALAAPACRPARASGGSPGGTALEGPTPDSTAPEAATPGGSAPDSSAPDSSAPDSAAPVGALREQAAFTALSDDVRHALGCLRPAWQATYPGPALLGPFLAGVGRWTAGVAAQFTAGLEPLAGTSIAAPPVTAAVPPAGSLAGGGAWGVPGGCLGSWWRGGWGGVGWCWRWRAGGAGLRRRPRGEHEGRQDRP